MPPRTNRDNLPRFFTTGRCDPAAAAAPFELDWEMMGLNNEMRSRDEMHGFVIVRSLLSTFVIRGCHSVVTSRARVIIESSSEPPAILEPADSSDFLAVPRQISHRQSPSPCYTSCYMSYSGWLFPGLLASGTARRALLKMARGWKLVKSELLART